MKRSQTEDEDSLPRKFLNPQELLAPIDEEELSAMDVESHKTSKLLEPERAFSF